ncbi:hypothetical protein ACH9L7_11150 [Haloferax sp. S1W]|uniref:DUF7093 family protein n=1 Tax=Haloferax sp. S1W TaxID=3377110 RepID=UPI0037C890A6
MGLTCRLLGHSYGEPETEREREERGDEVVVSIREVQVCSRCGDEQVISENKEVTAIRTPEEVGMTEAEVETAAAGFEPATPEPTTAADDSPIETAPDPETEAQTEAEPEPKPEPEPAQSASATSEETAEERNDQLNEPPVTDDAIILDDDDDEAGRDRTQWPDEVDEMDTEDPVPESTDDDAEFIDADAAATGQRESSSAERQTRERGAWPQQEGEDHGWDAQPDDGEPMSVSFSGGLRPEANGSVAPNSNDEFVEASDDEFVRAEESNLGSETPDEAVEYYCPNCGHSRGASASSMRAGDICPECRKGYIAERQA